MRNVILKPVYRTEWRAFL